MLNAVYGYLGYQIIGPTPVDFQVQADQDVYETQSLLNRTQKIAWEALSWIVFPIKLHESILLKVWKKFLPSLKRTKRSMTEVMIKPL